MVEDNRQNEEQNDGKKMMLTIYSIIVLFLCGIAVIIVAKACETSFVHRNFWLLKCKWLYSPDKGIT
jgi:hypothetical protein